jgi:hypothetical protein
VVHRVQVTEHGSAGHSHPVSSLGFSFL